MFVHRGYPHGDRDGYLHEGHICICDVGLRCSIAMLSASLHSTWHSTFGENAQFWRWGQVVKVVDLCVCCTWVECSQSFFTRMKNHKFDLERKVQGQRRFCCILLCMTIYVHVLTCMRMWFVRVRVMCMCCVCVSCSFVFIPKMCSLISEHLFISKKAKVFIVSPFQRPSLPLER